MMDAPAARESVTYTVACATCHAPFDALAALWCTCLVTERTLACPHCGHCFCRAPLEYKNYFWQDAPRAIWANKWVSPDERDQSDASPDDGSGMPRPLILVVDDEPAIRRLAARLLLRIGYGVATAKDGTEGLARARELHPDLVLTDALMPKGDGRDMGRLIKADPTLAGTRVVVMTAVYTSLKYSLDGFLTKPIAPAELEAVVRQQVGAPSRSSQPASLQMNASYGRI
jgi:CheY-like chemotaxis protein